MDRNLKQETELPKPGVLTLCGTKGCCPTVDFTNPNEVVFKDDHGGTVRLTQAEWKELKQFAKSSEV